MASAKGKSNLKASLIEDELALELKNQFTQIDYQYAAKTKILEELLATVVSEATLVTLDAKAKGSLKKLDIDLKTNLGQIISKALSRQLQAKINEAKEKIDKVVNEKIKGNKDKIDQKMAQISNQYQGQINKGKEQLSKLSSQIDGKKDESKNSVEDKGKEALDKLKKKFKF
jgi:uncharacterized protein (TIGR03545 family)